MQSMGMCFRNQTDELISAQDVAEEQWQLKDERTTRLQRCGETHVPKEQGCCHFLYWST